MSMAKLLSTWVICLGVFLAVEAQALSIAPHSVMAKSKQLLPHPAVDVVYAWVNGTDPSFAARYKHVTGKNPECERLVSSNVDQQHFQLDFLHPSCQKKITFVNLEEFVPEEYLPTFNSLVFEAFLHQIPGLSEHFIYMNDDTIITKPLNSSSFFTTDGRLKVLLLPHPDVDDSTKHMQEQPWLFPVMNAVILFRSVFKKDPVGQDAHSAYFLSKEAMKVTWVLFGAQLAPQLARNKLRKYAYVANGGDVHITSLAQQVGVQLGHFEVEHTLLQQLGMPVVTLPEWYPSHVLLVTLVDLSSHVSSLFSSQYPIVCLQEMMWLEKPQLQQLCSIVAQAWCQPVEWRTDHCTRFVENCSHKNECQQ